MGSANGRTSDWPTRLRRVRRILFAVAGLTLVFGLSDLPVANAAPEPILPELPTVDVPDPDAPGDVTTPQTPGAPTTPTAGAPDDPDGDDTPDASIDIAFPDVAEGSSNSVVIILMLTVLSIAPSLLVMCTSFTRIVIVLSLTRNALGIPTVPPQQVVVGLSVFLTLFVMGPTLGEMKDVALDPLLAGEITTSEALDAAQVPLRAFLLEHTRDSELALFLDASDTPTPVARDAVPLTALIPAFVLSELKSGFIMGFVIFVPFLVIDLVVSAVLMGLGMMMLPPSFVSLPFKLLLFVMLDGWMLVTGMLLTSYG
jgi:flagellar biosynthetic protein FliP